MRGHKTGKREKIGTSMGFLRHLNWMIAVACLAAGIAVIRWPFLIDPSPSSGPTTAATFAGAFIGAFAVFAGAQINESARRWEARVQLQNQQRRVRAILDNEFIRVCVNLMQEAADQLKIGKSSAYTLDFEEPLPTPIFESVRSEVLCLPENEIDALCAFYGGLDATRREIRDTSRAISLDRFLRNMHHDLKAAEEVVRKVWPSRKVQPSAGQPYSLAEKLKEQADAVAKGLMDRGK